MKTGCPEPVLILHNRPGIGQGTSACMESDVGVMEQVDAVRQALDRLGARCRCVGVVTIEEVMVQLACAAEPVVFNLVENLEGGPANVNAVPAICRAAGKGCTGGDSRCLDLTLDKWNCRAVLASHGVPVARAGLVPVGQSPAAGTIPEGCVIVKPLQADASEGIDSASVVNAASPALADAVHRIHSEFGQPALVEEFIDGREINVSILQEADRLHVLPFAEIDFRAFPPGLPRIVDYDAKWRPDSFVYKHTPRIIPVPLPDAVYTRLHQTALAAWQALDCTDYARVDLRMNDHGDIFVLEVNVNPDISPEGGYASALHVSGRAFEDFVASIVGNALNRRCHHPPAPSADVMSSGGGTIRRSVRADRDAILDLARRTRFFTAHEMAIADEVLEDALSKGAAGDYQSFTYITVSGAVAGWICYGHTPCTEGTYDVYWMVVHPDWQRRGIGAALLGFVETRISAAGGRLTVVETAGRAHYAPTRAFYEHSGYREVARVPGFYGEGDDKIIYLKSLPTRERTA